MGRWILGIGVMATIGTTICFEAAAKETIDGLCVAHYQVLLRDLILERSPRIKELQPTKQLLSAPAKSGLPHFTLEGVKLEKFSYDARTYFKLERRTARRVLPDPSTRLGRFAQSIEKQGGTVVLDGELLNQSQSYGRVERLIDAYTLKNKVTIVLNESLIDTQAFQYILQHEGLHLWALSTEEGHRVAQHFDQVYKYGTVKTGEYYILPGMKPGGSYNGYFNAQEFKAFSQTLASQGLINHNRETVQAIDRELRNISAGGSREQRLRNLHFDPKSIFDGENFQSVHGFLDILQNSRTEMNGIIRGELAQIVPKTKIEQGVWEVDLGIFVWKIYNIPPSIEVKLDELAKAGKMSERSELVQQQLTERLIQAETASAGIRKHLDEIKRIYDHAQAENSLSAWD